MSKATGLAHIGVFVRDFQASKAFYVDVLGFSAMGDYPRGNTVLSFVQAGSCILELIQKADFAPRTAGPVDHVAIAVDGLDEYVARLRQAGIVFETETIGEAPDLLGGMRSIFFSSPDGERLELLEYFNK